MQCSKYIAQTIQRAKNAPMTATRATRALDEPSDWAPFVLAAPAGETDPDAEGALVDAEGVDDELGPLAASFAAWLMSIGIMYGLPLELPRLKVPSADITSGLAPPNKREYMTFSATYCCAHSGIWLMSMLLPQLAAMLLFAVCMSVYAPIAAKAELFAIIADIIDETESDG